MTWRKRQTLVALSEVITDTRMGGTSVGDMEKAGQKADSLYRKQKIV